MERVHNEVVKEAKEDAKKEKKAKTLKWRPDILKRPKIPSNTLKRPKIKNHKDDKKEDSKGRLPLIKRANIKIIHRKKSEKDDKDKGEGEESEPPRRKKEPSHEIKAFNEEIQKVRKEAKKIKEANTKAK